MVLTVCLTSLGRWLGRALLMALIGAMAPLSLYASSPEIPGAQMPQFQAALTLWLTNDEDTSLGQFAQLARDGNEAAQTLLGVIDKSPALQGPYLAHLPRAERLRLLRAPGGISGRNWLHATQTPLAQAYRAMWTVDAGPEVIETLAQLGEARAVREALVTLSTRSHPALNTMPIEAVSPELLYLLWFSADANRRAQIEDLIPPNHPQRGHFGTSRDARHIDDWLVSAELTQPLTSLCQAACPQDETQQANCRSAAYHALDSHAALLLLGTPVAALIPQEQFVASPRGQAAVLRRILLSSVMRDRRAALATVAERSSCLAERLNAENHRYHPMMVTPAPQE